MDPSVLRSGLVAVHLFGLALGAGGAFVSDALFLHLIRDKKLQRHEIAILRITSKLVWAGLFLLVVSGIGLFLQDPERLLQSSKFLAKMIIVFILTANGLIFHNVHLPFFDALQGRALARTPGMLRARRWLSVSGAISGTSWTAALILGSLKQVPFAASEILTVYALAVGCACAIALAIEEWLIPMKR